MKNRIRQLRDKAVSPKICYEEFHLNFYRYFDENKLQLDENNYGDAFYYAFSKITPRIDENELIVGKTVSELTENDSKAWEEEYRQKAFEAMQSAGDGQDSHMAVDYELLLSKGINGVLGRIKELSDDCEEKKLFYDNCSKCLKAVVLLSDKYSELAAKMAEECSDESRKEELYKISEICRNVPANPAQNFYEAMQSVHFVTYCISYNPFRMSCQQFQLGRPDRYLLPYYNQDIEKGSITPEFAQTLFDCLAIQINNRVARGLSSGYMVGGRNSSGEVVANDLTMMGLQAIDNVRLVYPAVGLCYTKDMPDKYLIKACEILSHGCSHPAIFNDDIIAEGLMGYGIPADKARDYIQSTCVEITPIAASNVWVASPYINLAQILLSLLDGKYRRFEELQEAVKKEIGRHIKNNFEQQNKLRITRAENSVNPLLSCFVDDCLSTGTDIDKGGAKYNWIMPSFVGMANLVDSLYAIKVTVFDNKEISLDELKKELDNNFEGNELLRYRLLNKIDKYGNDVDEVDGLVADFVDFIVQECRKYKPVHQNAKLIPSVFCWIMHSEFGKDTGATPDGRCAGFPLGDGSGPCQGRELNGPTASILSSTKWSHKELIGGVAVNMKFSKKHFTDKSVSKIVGLIKTFIQRGGFELQINVVDKDTLINAKNEPENYRDLVVRIGGYSDYFVKLTKGMQDEVILRTEHEI